MYATKGTAKRYVVLERSRLLMKFIKLPWDTCLFSCILTRYKIHKIWLTATNRNMNRVIEIFTFFNSAILSWIIWCLSLKDLSSFSIVSTSRSRCPKNLNKPIMFNEVYYWTIGCLKYAMHICILMIGHVTRDLFIIFFFFFVRTEGHNSVFSTGCDISPLPNHLVSWCLTIPQIGLKASTRFVNEHMCFLSIAILFMKKNIFMNRPDHLLDLLWFCYTIFICYHLLLALTELELSSPVINVHTLNDVYYW